MHQNGSQSTIKPSANILARAFTRRCCMKPLAGEAVWPALLLTLCSPWLQPAGGAR